MLAVVGRRPDIRIPSDVEVPRAVNEGTPIVLAKPDSAAAKAYRSLAAEFLRREGDEPVETTAAEPDRRDGAQGLRGLTALRSRDSNGKAHDEAPGEARKRLRLGSRRR